MAIFVDEAHVTVEDSKSFRPVFLDATKSIKSLLDLSLATHPRMTVPLVAISAMFAIPTQIKFSRMLNKVPTVVPWGDMDKRSVRIFFYVVGSPVHAIMEQWHEDAMNSSEFQSLLYSNSGGIPRGLF